MAAKRPAHNVIQHLWGELEHQLQAKPSCPKPVPHLTRDPLAEKVQITATPPPKILWKAFPEVKATSFGTGCPTSTYSCEGQGCIYFLPYNVENIFEVTLPAKKMKISHTYVYRFQDGSRQLLCQGPKCAAMLGLTSMNLWIGRDQVGIYVDTFPLGNSGIFSINLAGHINDIET